MNETIAALATPPGKGGIAVIRISGEKAYEVASCVFSPLHSNKTLQNAKGYTALFGYFMQNGVVADEVVALCFRKPYSYTGEDVVELSCHGGSAISEMLLRACFEAGACPAPAGEFTRRAFLNGRISLTQAEAVMDLISATGKQAANAAAASMEGALYQKIKQVQTHLITLSGHLAAFIDYPEEDVPELKASTLQAGLEQDCLCLKELIDGYDTGAILRRGVQVAIVGSPNVGKSTLMNLLSGFERAIVTPIAGTTRDVVEQELMIAGIPIHLADTAGIRETQDVVEAEGIRRSYTHLRRAGLILAVYDASRMVTEEDILLAKECAQKPAIALLNKTDLPKQFDEEKIEPYFQSIVPIVAKEPSFLSKIETEVSKVLGLSHVDSDAILLANERQLVAAKQAYEALQEAKEGLSFGLTLDAIGVCMEDALKALYRLTGEDATEDVIEEVFAKFCVGK